MGVASDPSPSREGVVVVEPVALPLVGLFGIEGMGKEAEKRLGSEEDSN